MRMTMTILSTLVAAALFGAQPSMPAPDTTIRGVVTAVKGGTITIAKAIDVDVAAAKITRDGNAAAAADVVAGMRVRAVVNGSRPNGAMIAGTVIIESPDATIIGAVEAVSPASVTIAGQSLSVGATTSFGGFANGAAVRSAADVQAGTPVVVDVAVTGKGLAATRIVAIGPAPAAPPQPEPARTTLTGNVATIAKTEWTVGATKVYIAPKTLITGSPAVGDSVTVDGISTPSGAVIASTIRKP